MSNGLTTDAPVARLCHIIQLEDFDGYGFNLHAEKGKPGQFIGKVDEGSPAEAAGLKLGDRIIEVNGVNIANDNHKQVVQRIKSKQNETELLVVDSEADTYFKSNNITIHSGLPDILHLTTPITASTKIDSNDDKRGENSEDAQSQKSGKSVASADHEVLAMDNSAATTPSSERKHSPAYSPANSPEPQADSSDETLPSMETSHSNIDDVSIEQNHHNASLNLNMTAKELRAQLASRKKYDPKKESMDFKRNTTLFKSFKL